MDHLMDTINMCSLRSRTRQTVYQTEEPDIESMISSDAHVAHLASSVHVDRPQCLRHIDGILRVDGLQEQDAAAESLDGEQSVDSVVVWERLIIPHMLRCSMPALSSEAL